MGASCWAKGEPSMKKFWISAKEWICFLSVCYVSLKLLEAMINHSPLLQKTLLALL
jgi:hypothetical protein